MCLTQRLKRSVALCALVCAALISTPAGAASDTPAGIHAQERYYATLGNADTAAALAREQYLGSYGEPQPLGRPPSDDAPWLPIALAVAGTLVLAAAGTMQLRRLRLRRRRPAGLAPR
jgi:hypothetical protein